MVRLTLRVFILGFLLQAGLLQADQTGQELMKRARALALDGKFTASLPYFEKLQRKEPYHEKARYFYAVALIYQESDPGSGRYRSDLSRAIAMLEQSIQDYLRVNERGEELGLRYFYQGLAHWYNNDALKALYAFRRSYRADFERLDAVYNQYAILEELGKHDEARLVRNQYQRLLKSNLLDD